MKKNYSLIILIFYIVLYGCNSEEEVKPNNEATITFQFDVNMDSLDPVVLGRPSVYLQSDTLKLDSLGRCLKSFSISVPTFAKVSYGKKGLFSFVIEPKKNLSIQISDSVINYEGESKHVNLFITEVNEIYKHYNDSMDYVLAPDSLIPFELIIGVTDFFKKKFDILYAAYQSQHPFDEKTGFLIKNDFYAFSLIKKQFYLNQCYDNEIDSLNLEEKLEIKETKFYKDNYLLEASNLAMLFIFHNYQYKLSRQRDYFAKLNVEDLGLFIGDSIQKSKQLSPIVKEFIFYSLIFDRIYRDGATKVSDSLVHYFQTKYPESIYNQNLNNSLKQFVHLDSLKKAPSFELTSIDGEVYNLSDFKGKLVFIDVWATWCKPCRDGFPKVIELIEKYKDNEVVFLFMSNDKDEEKWKKYLKEHPELKGLHFRIKGSSFGEIYNITGIPRYILIDKEGKVIDAFATSKNMFSLIEKNLK